MMKKTRKYSAFDKFITHADRALRTLLAAPEVTERPYPAERIEEAELTEKERDHHGRLMRINHTGEICAQALYQGQGLTAKLPEVRDQMKRAADEENDHLDWCKNRIKELDGRTSFLNPFWFVASYGMGSLAGFIGDKWSLGFVAETERQVGRHLKSHLNQIPIYDQRTRVIIEQMALDEARHKEMAIKGGAAKLPFPIKMAMKVNAKIMTKTVYYF